MSTRIAAIVVTHKRPASLQRALDGLDRQRRRPDLVVVVDNSPEPSVLPPRPDRVLVATRDNLGYAGGLARGLDELPSDVTYALLMDDDSSADPDLVARLAAILDEVDELGIIGTGGGTLRLGVPQHARSRGRVDTASEHLSTVDYCLVDHALVRMSVIRTVGPPEPGLFMGFEDVEFTDRIRRAGWKIAVLDGVIERGHLGTGSAWRAYYQTRNHGLVALRRRSPRLILGWVLRSVWVTVAAAVVLRDPMRVRLRARGFVDALRGRDGRTVEPS